MENTMDLLNKSKLIDWVVKGDHVVIIQMTHCGDDQGDKIEKSLNGLDVLGNWKVTKKKDQGQTESFFSVTPNIRFKAEFGGKVIDMVKDLIEKSFSKASDSKKLVLKQNETPFFINLFITPFCPHCPNVVRDMTRMALDNSNIHLDIIDGLLYENLSKQYRIKSAPTLVYGDNFRWTGQVDMGSVMEALDNENPEFISPKALLAMIEAGRASTVAKLMVERNVVFNSLFTLLMDEKWSVRLGAMVVAEEIGGLCPELAAKLMDRLWQAYETSDGTVKGDIIYLAGVIGDERFVRMLKMLDGDVIGSELEEAVHEALQSLAERFNDGI